MFERVFHPTDFSKTSEVAFAHGLKVALASRGQLAVLHVVPEGGEGGAASFPKVRGTLAAWGLVATNCQPQDIAALGVRIKKLEIEADDPSGGITDYLSERPTDLVVLATHQHAGMTLWTHPPVAEPVMRSTHVPSLFIPPDSEGFVRVADGAVSLRRVLVPVAREPDPQAAIDTAHGLAGLLGATGLEVTVLHVGDEARAPRLRLPTEPAGWTWSRVSVEGPVVETIVEAATGSDTDLVVMTSRGPKGFLGSLRGGKASNIIRKCACPVLAVPRE
jgi:nucleotide-binding universal stress UspA family protein